jgi:tetratricopeptide (TPR) repeat protein
LNQEGNYAQAVESYRRGVAVHEQIATGANVAARTHLAGDYTGLGKTLWRTGDLSGAVENARKATGILEQLSQQDPTNATIREYLGEAYDLLSVLLERQGDLEQSSKYSRKAYEDFTELASADPQNFLARANRALTDEHTGEILAREGKFRGAMPHFQNAIGILEPVEDKNRYEVGALAEAYSSLAAAYVSLAKRDRPPGEKARRLREAQSWYRKSLKTWSENPNANFENPSNGNQSDRVAEQLASCEAALAKLQTLEE